MLEKTRKTDNEASILKETEMKSEAHNSVRHPAKLSKIRGLSREPSRKNGVLHF